MSNGIMPEKYRSIFLLGTVFCIVLQTSTAAITSTNCTHGNDPDGDKKCQGVDPNAECPAAKDKCACKTGYKIDPDDDTSCLLSITSTDCTHGNDPDGDKKCQGVDPNAECPTGKDKCACKTGYKIDPDDDTSCLLSITQVPCTPGHATDGDAKCEDLDTNSECPTTASTCACKSGYTGTDTCTKLPITDVDCVPGDENNGDAKCQDLDENSECPTDVKKCACKTGYTGTDTCSDESSADSVKVTTTVIATALLSFIVRRIM